MDTVSNTALQTLEGMAPTILQAAGAIASPQTAAIISLAPVAIQFLQTSMQLHAAGVMTDEQLANQFAIVGQGIQATHNKWVSMNVADAAKQSLPSNLVHQAA